MMKLLIGHELFPMEYISGAEDALRCGGGDDRVPGLELSDMLNVSLIP